MSNNKNKNDKNDKNDKHDKHKHFYAVPPLFSWYDIVGLVWHVFCGLVGLTVFFSFWNTHGALVMSMLLIGLIIFIVLYLVNVLYNGSHIDRLGYIIFDRSSDVFHHDSHEFLTWSFGHHLYLTNIIAYFVGLLFYGIWLVTSVPSFTQYQPLPIVPTNSDIDNLIVHKGTAIVWLVVLSGYNLCKFFESTKFVFQQVFNAIRHTPSVNGK